MRWPTWMKTDAEREQAATRKQLQAVRKAMQEEIDALQNALSHATDKGRKDAAN